MRLLALLLVGTFIGCADDASRIVSNRGAGPKGLEGSRSGQTGSGWQAMRPGPPPATRRNDVVDVYHGVTVVDPYRWMETASEERDRWFAAQNDYARRVLRALPGRDRLRDQLREWNREGERFQVLRVIGDRPQIFALRRS